MPLRRRALLAALAACLLTSAPAAAAPFPGPDPATPGPYATLSSDYTLPPVKLPGLREPVEFVGHVVEPAPDAATGPRPLVLFLHGRHASCYRPKGARRTRRAGPDDWPCRGTLKPIPNELGYDYLQKLLASQGEATVSIQVNAIDAQDDATGDFGAGARAAMVLRHLDHWAGMAAAHQVDLSRVVLVGHSRGGEGVARAATEIGPGAPYTVVGEVLLAPTDFAAHGASYVPTVTLLPYCDGDVSGLEGQLFVDGGRDLFADDTALKSAVLVQGANHNFFNTEWTPGLAKAPAEDNATFLRGKLCRRTATTRLSPAQQRGVAAAYVGGAVKLFLGDTGLLGLFDGSGLVPSSIAVADVRSAALGGGRVTRRPGVDTTPLGAGSRLCLGGVIGRGRTCYADARGGVAPHWLEDGVDAPARAFLDLRWKRPGVAGGLALSQPLDLTAGRLELRTIVEPGTAPGRVGVRIADGTGAAATLDPSVTLRALPGREDETKLWAQSLVVGTTGATGVDLADVRQVRLVPASRRGHVWVADVSAAPATLAPPPATRAPRVDLGQAEVREGDPPRGRREALVEGTIPFTVTGALSAPAAFVYEARGLRGVVRRTVTIAPGQTRGTIPVRYDVDRRHDRDDVAEATAWALRGVTVGAWVGRLTVHEDDPRRRQR